MVTALLTQVKKSLDSRGCSFNRPAGALRGKGFEHESSQVGVRQSSGHRVVECFNDQRVSIGKSLRNAFDDAQSKFGVVGSARHVISLPHLGMTA